MCPYSIVLTDDHAMFREGVRKILEMRDEIEVVGEADNGIELLNLLKEGAPDMVIIDITMPALGGIEATRRIRSASSTVKILVLSMHDDREYLSQAIAAGADGYLLKSAAGKELFTALDTIIDGAFYISPTLAERLPDDFINICRARDQPFSNSLTLREREVLKHIAEGKTSREIADLLYISHRTVEKHRSNIMIKLDLNNLPALVRYAIHKGYATSKY
ncbi:MAG: response regulator [Thermodesulfobacteriota bacterium]